MADIVSSIVYVLHQEDRRMLGEVTINLRDSGGRTRFGIAERWHPELTASGFFDEEKMNSADALVIAERVYTKQYGSPLMIASIKDQQVANALLSFAVNEGVQTAIEVLQTALGLDADGAFGTLTLKAVNATSNILQLLDSQQTAHYKNIVVKIPKDACFLNGWLNRVKENCEVAA